ncbi:hypothetical protein [Anaerococcus sp. Marseille-Q7828]|uniref:hypothetical protein n=1 Tax=Anaerococcus sp. Marseille-Q7828 TaxID=3036300 RepID=UPI0024AC9D6C|nr:hypothetical protein [Anaerococcus sp. Marseille-Q7828]
MKKIILMLISLFLLSACNKDESYEIKFATGEVYNFEDLTVSIISDEEKMIEKDIFTSFNDKEKTKKIVDLLAKCQVVDESYSYASIPDANSLIINLKNKDREESIYMYDSIRDESTNKFHYTFYNKLGKYDNPTLLSDDDLISQIKDIVDH